MRDPDGRLVQRLTLIPGHHGIDPAWACHGCGAALRHTWATGEGGARTQLVIITHEGDCPEISDGADQYPGYGLPRAGEREDGAHQGDYPVPAAEDPWKYRLRMMQEER